MMIKEEHKDRAEILRNLPSTDALLRSETARRLIGPAGAGHLAELARRVTETLRAELRERGGADNGSGGVSRAELLAEAESRLAEAWRRERASGLRRVINASGVVIHTNLGRAPLSDAAREALIDASRYCSLEYDTETGRRGRRGARAERLLAELTGAEEALIVNNCAAACVLVLTELCRGGEAVVSRGELVEIGGDFRIPDVMERSGAELVEVGTTNRTRVSDYERAVTDKTRLFVRVHPSNYRIQGFTAAPDEAELAAAARRHGLLLYHDAGSGALNDLAAYGLGDEPVIARSVGAGTDVVTFSGDKLLGGVQAGLIVGRAEIVKRLRRNPLFRALRGSKLVYAVLEATLEAFRRGTAEEEVPVLRMLSASAGEIERRTDEFLGKLSGADGGSGSLSFEKMPGNSVVGGGSAPGIQPATTLLAVSHEDLSAARLEEELRRADPPVVARIVEDRVVLDLRTVSPAEEDELVAVLRLIGS